MSNTDGNKRSNQEAFKKLLDQLQMESWQLELIISGVALFAVWELKSVVGFLSEFQDVYGRASTTTNVVVGIFGMGLSVSWIVLFINLIVHIFSRGLWIGMIGLRYVSQDIDYESLNYAPKFDNFLRKKIGFFDDYIEKLERFSSILFAYTFFLIFLLISFISLFGSFILLGYVFIELIGDNAIAGIFFIFFLLGGLFVLIDFISLGAIKKVRDKSISNIYFWIYRFFSFITLSFLYRPLLYNFLDDKFARKFFLFSIPYFLIIFFFTGLIFNPTPHFPFRNQNHPHDVDQSGKLSITPVYYDEERTLLKKNIFGSKRAIKTVSIPSKVITENYSQLFLRIYHRDEDYFEKKKGISAYDKKGILYAFRSDEKNNEKDKIQTNIKTLRDSILRLHILEKVTIIKQLRKDSLTNLTLGTKMLDEKIVLDTAYWKNQRDSIEAAWEVKIEKAKKEKVYNIKDAILELNTVSIDDIPYNDSLSCKFYIHPNLGERGLLCFFSTKSLNDGEHLLKVKRKDFRTVTSISSDTIETERIDIDSSMKVVPFYIYKD